MADRWRNSSIQEDVVHSTPLEILEQAIQPLLHAVDVHVVAKARLAVDSTDTRLVTVYFPRVKVEDRRLSFAAVNLSQHPP